MGQVKSALGAGGARAVEATLEKIISDVAAENEFQLYKLVNYRRGGSIMESCAAAGPAGVGIREVERICREVLLNYLYDKGRGRTITTADCLAWRRRLRKEVAVPVERKIRPPPSKERGVKNNVAVDGVPIHTSVLSPSRPYDTPLDHEGCWMLEQRGALGENPLHVLVICDTPTHTRVAKIILNHYPKLVNDIMEGSEYYGLSPLHLAVAYNNMELVQAFVSAGAHANERAVGKFFMPSDQKDRPKRKTNYEGLSYLGEYPLSWAACCENEAIYNYLLDRGADPNLQDTFGNMILHMVVISNKLGMYGYALRHPKKPANNEIVNRAGLTPLTLACVLGRNNIFREMLELSSVEFWRFSNITCSAYPLIALDTIRPDGGTNWKSALMIILDGETQEHLDMLEGGVIQRLLEDKWKTFARNQFLKRLGFLFLHLVVISIAVYLRPPFEDSLKWSSDVKSIVRHCAEFGSLLGCGLFVFVQQGSEIVSQGFVEFGTNLARSPAKFIFLVSNICILICIPCRLLSMRLVEDSLLTFALPGTWFFLMFFAGAVRLTGPFVTMIYSMIAGDMVRFGIIYLIMLLGFSQAFYFLFKSCHVGVREADETNIDLYETFIGTWMALYQMTLGNYQVFSVFCFLHFLCLLRWSHTYSDFSKPKYSGLSLTIFVIFMVLVPILLLNMLIAMMGNTYANVISKSEKEFVKQWAKIVLALERSVNKKSCKEHLNTYGINLGPPPSDGSEPMKGLMVIKSKNKTKAQQRKGALLNWRRVGKKIVGEMRKYGCKGDQLLQTKSQEQAKKGIRRGSFPALFTDNAEGGGDDEQAGPPRGGLGEALSQLAFAHDIDITGGVNDMSPTTTPVPAVDPNSNALIPHASLHPQTPLVAPPPPPQILNASALHQQTYNPVNSTAHTLSPVGIVPHNYNPSVTNLYPTLASPQSLNLANVSPAPVSTPIHDQHALTSVVPISNPVCPLAHSLNPAPTLPQTLNPSSPFPQPVNPTGPFPQTLNPTVPFPQPVNPTGQIPLTLNPTVPLPQTLNPTGPFPQTLNLTGPLPQTVNSTAPLLQTLNPIGPLPQTLNSTGLLPQTLNPTGLLPQTLNPTGLLPQTLNPAGPLPQTLNPIGPLPQTCPLSQTVNPSGPQPQPLNPGALLPQQCPATSLPQAPNQTATFTQPCMPMSPLVNPQVTLPQTIDPATLTMESQHCVGAMAIVNSPHAFSTSTQSANSVPVPLESTVLIPIATPTDFNSDLPRSIDAVYVPVGGQLTSVDNAPVASGRDNSHGQSRPPVLAVSETMPSHNLNRVVEGTDSNDNISSNNSQAQFSHPTALVTEKQGFTNTIPCPPVHNTTTPNLAPFDSILTVTPHQTEVPSQRQPTAPCPLPETLTRPEKIDVPSTDPLAVSPPGNSLLSHRCTLPVAPQNPISTRNSSLEAQSDVAEAAPENSVPPQVNASKTQPRTPPTSATTTTTTRRTGVNKDGVEQTNSATVNKPDLPSYNDAVKQPQPQKTTRIDNPQPKALAGQSSLPSYDNVVGIQKQLSKDNSLSVDKEGANASAFTDEQPAGNQTAVKCPNSGNRKQSKPTSQSPLKHSKPSEATSPLTERKVVEQARANRSPKKLVPHSSTENKVKLTRQPSEPRTPQPALTTEPILGEPVVDPADLVDAAGVQPGALASSSMTSPGISNKYKHLRMGSGRRSIGGTGKTKRGKNRGVLRLNKLSNKVGVFPSPVVAIQDPFLPSSGNPAGQSSALDGASVGGLFLGRTSDLEPPLAMNTLSNYRATLPRIQSSSTSGGVTFSPSVSWTPAAVAETPAVEPSHPLNRWSTNSIVAMSTLVDWDDGTDLLNESQDDVTGHPDMLTDINDDIL